MGGKGRRVNEYQGICTWDEDNCQSLTHGEKPVIQRFNTPEDEMEFIVKEIKDLEAAGVPRKDICLVARTHKLINGYKDGLRNNGIDVFEITTNKVDDRSRNEVRIATMHRVKGLEFNYIFAAGVNNKALPNGARSDFSDDVSLEEFETEEKCLLYPKVPSFYTKDYDGTGTSISS